MTFPPGYNKVKCPMCKKVMKIKKLKKKKMNSAAGAAERRAQMLSAAEHRGINPHTLTHTYTLAIIIIQYRFY